MPSKNKRNKEWSGTTEPLGTGSDESVGEFKQRMARRKNRLARDQHRREETNKARRQACALILSHIEFEIALCGAVEGSAALRGQLFRLAEEFESRSRKKAKNQPSGRRGHELETYYEHNHGTRNNSTGKIAAITLGYKQDARRRAQKRNQIHRKEDAQTQIRHLVKDADGNWIDVETSPTERPNLGSATP